MGKLNGNGWAYIANTNRKDYMGNVMVNFSKDFGKHHIDALALMEGQKYTYDWNSQEAHGFDTNYFKFNNMKAAANVSWGNLQLRAVVVQCQLAQALAVAHGLRSTLLFEHAIHGGLVQT